MSLATTAIEFIFYGFLFCLVVYLSGRLFGAGVIKSYLQMKERKKDHGQKPKSE